MYKENEEVVDILHKTGAVVKNSHFVYISGKHAPIYVNKDYIFPHTSYISRIGEIIAEKYKDYEIIFAKGGIDLAMRFQKQSYAEN